MKIGELNERCGECELIEYCTEPYCTPKLCTYEELADVEESEYTRIAESITVEEIEDKLKQYEKENISPWDDEYNGAICDIVLENCIQAGEVDES